MLEAEPFAAELTWKDDTAALDLQGAGLQNYSSTPNLAKGLWVCEHNKETF